MKTAVNLALTSAGPPWPDAGGLVLSRTQARQVAVDGSDGRPPVLALHLPDLPGYGLADGDPAVRQSAVTAVEEVIAAAAGVGAGVVWLVATARRASAPPGRRPTYEESLARIADALLELRFAAERHGVVLSVDCARTGTVTSPVEAAELVDRVCSPWVGWHVDAAGAADMHDPCDWIETLGGRLRSVSLADLADESGVRRALEAQRFAGLLIA